VIPEVGNLVRLTRDEAGPIVTAYAGEWGRIVRVTTRNTLDIQLAGFHALEASQWRWSANFLPSMWSPVMAADRRPMAGIWGLGQNVAAVPVRAVVVSCMAECP